mmetsp:Transcript_5831/g.19307  ORF Transcript_5831/g.19307 Transcript_5831/m.19307 type:complete len:228 (-) Transcript_5831:178-861(-)
MQPPALDGVPERVRASGQATKFDVGVRRAARHGLGPRARPRLDHLGVAHDGGRCDGRTRQHLQLQPLDIRLEQLVGLGDKLRLHLDARLHFATRIQDADIVTGCGTGRDGERERDARTVATPAAHNTRLADDATLARLLIAANERVVGNRLLLLHQDAHVLPHELGLGVVAESGERCVVHERDGVVRHQDDWLRHDVQRGHHIRQVEGLLLIPTLAAIPQRTGHHDG